MKKYEFEYQYKSYGAILLSFCFAIFFALFFILLELKNYLNFYLIIIISFGIPYLIFRIKKGKVKQNGYAFIEENYTEIFLKENKEKINFSDIKNYQVNIFKGTITLLIYLKNGKKIGLASNPEFCETGSFENYCSELEISIEEFLNLNKLEMIRIKSFSEKTWFYPTLIIVTGISILFTIIILFKKNEFPLFIFAGLFASILAFWANYYNTKKRNSNLKIKRE